MNALAQIKTSKMLTQLSQTIYTTTAKKTIEEQRLQFQQNHHMIFHAVLESLSDGVLLFSSAGEIVYANQGAYQICFQHDANNFQSSGILNKIRRVLRIPVNDQNASWQQSTVIETDIRDEARGVYWMRTYWLKLQESTPYLLIILEDQKQTLQHLVIAETIKYKLTPREAEIWLLRRVGSTYQEIATQLYISLNTVKKHLKNIYAKQKTFSVY